MAQRDDRVSRCTLKRANQNRVGQNRHKRACSVVVEFQDTSAHFLCLFCSQSLHSVRHFLRWQPYRGTASLSLLFTHAMGNVNLAQNVPLVEK